MMQKAQAQDLSGGAVALSGAAGFIGSRIVAHLAGRGAKVRALLRSGHDAARLRALGAEVAIAPLRPGAALVRALEGQDAVIHAAHDVRAGADANIAAFEALLGAMGKAGVGRLVHLSSVVVYDGWPQDDLDEDAPWGSTGGGPYRQSKIHMENRLLDGNIHAAILQPTLVWGPGSAIWTRAPMAALAAGGLVLPEGAGRAPLVHVEDVAAACGAALASGARGRYLISGPQSPRWLELYEGYRRIAGGEILIRPLAEIEARLPPPQDAHAAEGPGAAARVSALLRRAIGSRRFDALMERLRSSRGNKEALWPDRHMLDLYLASPRISCARARKELGFEPRITLTEGLKDLAARRQAAAGAAI